MITFDRFRKVVNPKRRTKVVRQFAIHLISLQSAFVILNLDGITAYVSQQNTTIKTNHSSIIFSSSACVFPQPLGLAIDVLNVCLRAYLPFLLMFVMNIVLARKFFVLMAKSKTQMTNNNISKRRIENNFTRTVIVMDVMFFVLYTPWSIWYVVHAMSSRVTALQTPLAIAYISLFQAITYCISYVNNFTSFFLNFAFNSCFRKRVTTFVRRHRINNVFFLRRIVLISSAN